MQTFFRRCSFALFVAVLISSPVWAEFSVLNFGDSLTLQSSEYLPAELGAEFDVHSVTVNAQQSANGVANIGSWLTDPDDNPATSHPATWDVVRFNHGIWDAVPVTGGVTSTEDYVSNISLIVDAIRQHSPGVKIVFSTSPLIDPNRVTLDPPPASGLVDYPTYNARLTDFRDEVAQYLPTIGVLVDDKYTFYHNNDPADFTLPPPTHENTDPYWHWDGIHFDESYRQFEASQTAEAIMEAASILRSDLNLDEMVTVADYLILDQYGLTDMSELTFKEAHLRGDLDGDFDSDLADYYLFKQDFDTANGAGAFAAMLAAPEPSSWLLLAIGLAGYRFRQRRGRDA